MILNGDKESIFANEKDIENKNEAKTCIAGCRIEYKKICRRYTGETPAASADAPGYDFARRTEKAGRKE